MLGTQTQDAQTGEQDEEQKSEFQQRDEIQKIQTSKKTWSANSKSNNSKLLLLCLTQPFSLDYTDFSDMKRLKIRQVSGPLKG